MKFKSIKTRFLFYIVTMIFIIVCSRFMYFYFFEGNTHMLQLESEMNNVLDMGANSFKQPLWSYNMEIIEDISANLIINQNIEEISIYDQEGQLIFNQIKGEKNINSLLYTKTHPIIYDNLEIGQLKIAYTDDYSKAKLRDEIFNQSIMSMLLLLALSIISSIIISRITRPIKELSDVALNISKGDMNNVIKIKTQDEIGILAITIDGMQTQLRNHLLEMNGKQIEIQALYEQAAAMNNELENMVHTLNNSYDETILALANAIEANDSYTRGHCDRVQRISLAIAQRFGMEGEDIRILSMAAILHDIGKIGIPQEVLNKRTPLTDEEFEMIKQHGKIGYNILKNIESLSVCAQIVLEHHERYDGKGYTLGLKGNEIMKEARIVSVADAFDAMTSARIYRETVLSEEQAIAQLIMGKNKQFDGEMVDIFVDLLNKGLDI